MDTSCGKSKSIMRLDIEISDESDASIFQGAAKVLAILRPNWPQAKITFKLLTDGITNKLVQGKIKDGDERDAVLIRIYGRKTDLLIDRKAETRNILMLNKYALAPSLYATFTNGLAYEFVPGSTLTSESVRTPEIYTLIARNMAKMHKIKPQSGESQTPTTCLWNKMDAFLRLVPDTFTKKHIADRVQALDFTKQEIIDEIDNLKAHLVKLRSPVVFCHNDLLLGNVIYTPECQKVTFIDYEYADWNNQAYDIGNHFAEFAGVENPDYAQYPNKEFQYKWLREYLAEFYKGEDYEVDERKVDELYAHANQFALACHLLWTLWCFIQAEHSYIEFDFIRYSSLRFNEYKRRKDEFLALS